MQISRRAILFALVVTFVVAGTAIGGAALSRSSAVPKSLKCPAGYLQEKDAGGACMAAKHPESLFETIVRQEAFESVRSAPYDHVAPGAFANAVNQAAQSPQPSQVTGTTGKATSLGTTPLIVNGPAYSSVNGLGFVYNMGRIDSLDYDAAHNRLLAALGTGGVWMSDDLGDHWGSIGESLPSQIVGAVAWSSANGGTIVAISGDPTFGAGGYTGYGAFYSTDLGATWQKATGIPDGALGFEIVVDKRHTNRIYAATSKGLFRSADGGVTYSNVNLPVGGGCAGTQGGGNCQLANVVTDVAVREPGGVNANVGADTVLAVVGWRASDRKNIDGSLQSPGQGLYRSDTGAPGTFSKVTATGWPSQHRQGRVEFGPALGPAQDHDYIYAIVQDAAALNGELDALDLDAQDPSNSVRPGTVLNGIYVSADFGKTWLLMADDNVIAKDPASGSALVGYGQAVGYEPGVQAWYNDWIAPDPTMTSADGVPTRLAFGLEEIWQNEVNAPLIGPTTFKVIGRYYGGTTCMFLTLGLPSCPTNRDTATSTTTHPDQHEGIWIPDGSGGVTLAVTNDGGFYKQHVAAGSNPSNASWGDGNQTGFNTLLPYDAAMANDGTVWAGLQDNGHMKIKPDGRQFETYGGDGTFAEVDPANSSVAYEAYVYADMRVTTDGGKSWKGIAPPATNTRFVNPFEMDPLDANHLVTGGREIFETTFGPETNPPDLDAGVQLCSDTCWVQVFDLGTKSHPGDPDAQPPTLDPSSDPANQMSAIDTFGDATYVGFCGVCDILNQKVGFKNGIATNVGGSAPQQKMTPNGWHIARAAGLPNRFITSVQISPKDPKTVYVTLGGYSRRWVPPGTVGDPTPPDPGVGHLFVSHDAGETFTDISGNLPDVPATWVALRGTGPQLIVGTDVGAFATVQKGGTTFARLAGLPNVPISTINLKPNNPNLLVIATYGRGVWTYRFDKSLPGTKGGGDTVAIERPAAPTGAAIGGPYRFDLGTDGWTADPAAGAMFFRLGAPGANGSATSFQVIPYTDEANATVASPPIVQTGGWVFVDFQNHRNTEPSFDFLHVEWSTDGATWKEAPWVWDRSISDWNDELTFDGKNPDFPGFTLEKVAFKVPAGTLRVRFRLTSDQLISSPLYTGVAVDDVLIHR